MSKILLPSCTHMKIENERLINHFAKRVEQLIENDIPFPFDLWTHLFFILYEYYSYKYVSFVCYIFFTIRVHWPLFSYCNVFIKIQNKLYKASESCAYVHILCGKCMRF